MAERLYKRGSTWWCTVYDASGKRINRSTRQKYKQAAKDVLREFERRVADPAYAASHSTTVSEALEGLIRDRTLKGRAADTIKFYRAKCGHLIRMFGAATPLARIDARAVDGYIGQRLREGAARNTISKELTALRGTLKVAKRRREFPADIDAVMPDGFSAQYKPKERYLTPEEAERLLAELLPDRAAQVAFMLGTGARWGECERAMRQDVDLAGSVVRLRGTKTASSERKVPLASVSQTLVEHAVRYGQGEGGQLFLKWGNVRRDLEQACERAHLDKVTPNDLRRSCATWMRASGVAPDLIGVFLGHRDSRMVERTYGRVSIESLASTLRRQMGAPDCSVYVANQTDSETSEGSMANVAEPRNSKTSAFSAGFLVSRDGIEPPTRGFSIPVSRVVSSERH